MTISCSYLSSNDKERVINELNKTNVDYIHLDIMDGKFTENETLDFNTLRNYFYENTKKLDVHLMVKDVKLYTELYSLLNPEYIIMVGEIFKDNSHAIEIIEEEVSKRALKLSSETVRIAKSSLGEDAATIGAVTLVIKELFKGEKIVFN